MDNLNNKILLKKYRIIRRIGKGAFGSVYLGKNIENNNYIAIKLENRIQSEPILEHETYILYKLRGFGIPQVISYGHNNIYNILIQQLLGKSLDKILYEKNNKFSLKDSIMCGIQILSRLEYIHNKGIIHRDIKADNFLIGLKNKEIIYIIDFGLAKLYKSEKTGKHVKYMVNKKWSGTSRFASANTLRGIEPSRRDDLESFCYLMLLLMKGNLPWDKLNLENEYNEILMIYKMKQYMKADIMFKNLPPQMSKIYKYVKNLDFAQNPDYNYLKKLLINILEFIGEKNDLYFSWVINNNINNNIINKNNNKKCFYKSVNNSKEKQKNINYILPHKRTFFLNDNNKNNLKKKIVTSNSEEQLGKKNLDIKNNILGHCNIIRKTTFLKSQSPLNKRENNKNDYNYNIIHSNKNINMKKRIKKNIVIDLTEYIENKKANEIKSYKTKLYNYKKNEKLKHNDINILTEKKINKNNKILRIKPINHANRVINKVTTYSLNDINKFKNKINGINIILNNNNNKIKSKSPNLSSNKKLNLYEVYKKDKKIKNLKYSNSFVKEINLIYSTHNGKSNLILPKRQKTNYSYNNIKQKNIIENGINKYNITENGNIKRKSALRKIILGNDINKKIFKIIHKNSIFKYININTNNTKDNTYIRNKTNKSPKMILKSFSYYK